MRTCKGGRCTQNAIVYTVTRYWGRIGQDLIKSTVILAAETLINTESNIKNSMMNDTNDLKENGKKALMGNVLG